MRRQEKNGMNEVAGIDAIESVHKVGLYKIPTMLYVGDKNRAEEKLKAGASLIQLYTGFIYEGPALIKKINRYLSRSHKQE